MSRPDPLALRRLALAVSVLDEVELEPYAGGVVLSGGRAVAVTWRELRRAVGPAELESTTARHRAARWLRARRWLADTPEGTLESRVRPVGFPVDDPLHPGLDWVQERVLGNALDLGVGVLGLGRDPDAAVALPQGCLDATRFRAAMWWPAARHYLERMGAVAAERLAASPSGVLRPIGDCDVVTLVGSRQLRAALVRREGTGMCAAAVPMRTRGWLDLSRIDPAFTVAAAAATDPVARGFERPLLLTLDEVAMAVAGGRPEQMVLRDPAVAAPAS